MGLLLLGTASEAVAELPAGHRYPAPVALTAKAQRDGIVPCYAEPGPEPGRGTRFSGRIPVMDRVEHLPARARQLTP